MTRKLFWEDPYRTSATTLVSAIDGDTVSVAKTVFYAESGSQESDHGTIGGHIWQRKRTGRKSDIRCQQGTT